MRPKADYFRITLILAILFLVSACSVFKKTYDAGLVLAEDPQTGTIRIEKLKDSSVLEKKGFSVGQEIAAVNGKKIKDLELKEVEVLLQGSEKITLSVTVSENGKEKTLNAALIYEIKKSPLDEIMTNLWIGTTLFFFIALISVIALAFRETIKKVFQKIFELTFERYIYTPLATSPLFNWYSVTRYYKELLKRLKVKILWVGSIKEQQVEDIFISLRIDREPDGTVDKQKKVQKDIILDAEKVVTMEDLKKVVITGIPGSGKTTLLKWIAHKLYRRTLVFKDKREVPLFIELKHMAVHYKHADSINAFFDYLELHFKDRRFPNARKFIEKMYENGKFVFLFDGLDEVPDSAFDTIVTVLTDVCNRYKDNKIFITCRTATYKDQLRGCTDKKVSIQDFEHEDLKKYINLDLWQWKKVKEQDSHKSPERLIKTLEETPRVYQLCKNPLLLNIMTYLYTMTTADFPQSRASFYKTCVDSLLSEWLRIRGVYNTRFSKDDKEKVLSQLAYEKHKNVSHHEREEDSVSGDFTQKELYTSVRKIMNTIGLEDRDNKEMVKEIIRSSGLLIEIPGELYRFAHLTFQEYFAAREIKEREEGEFLKLQVRDMLQSDQELREKNKKHWYEVIRLYAAIAPHTKETKEILRLLIGNDTAFAAHCITDMTEIDPDVLNDCLDRLFNEFKKDPVNPDIHDALSSTGSDTKTKKGQRVRDFLRQCININGNVIAESAVTVLFQTVTFDSFTFLCPYLDDKNLGETVKELFIKEKDLILTALHKHIMTKSKENQHLSFEQELIILRDIYSRASISYLLDYLSNDDLNIARESALQLAIAIEYPHFVKLIRQWNVPSSVKDNQEVKSLLSWVNPLSSDKREPLNYLSALIVKILTQWIREQGPEALDLQIEKWGQMSLLILMPVAIDVREKEGKPFYEEKSLVRRFLVSIIGMRNGYDLLGKVFFIDTINKNRIEEDALLKEIKELADKAGILLGKENNLLPDSNEILNQLYTFEIYLIIYTRVFEF